MLNDARSIENGSELQADICIVGAGVAGITLCSEFMQRHEKLILVEGGGMGFSKSLAALPSIIRRHLLEEQALASGTNAGRPYYPLRFTRVRSFGGSSRAWAEHGLQSRPLDAIDLEPRRQLPLHGWPFSVAELEPFYRRAQVVCNLGPYDYESANWEERGFGARLPLDNTVVEPRLFQFGRQSSFERYERELASCDNINILLHATAVNVSHTTAKIEHIDCAAPCGRRFKVRAESFVLAAGAIENARLLMASRDQFPTGIGNRHDLVGRFFMEHYDVEAGFFVPASDYDAKTYSLYFPQRADASLGIQTMFRLSDETLTREGLLNSVLRIRPSYASAMLPALRSVRSLRRALHLGVPIPGIAAHAMKVLGGAKDVLCHQISKLRDRKPDVLKLDVMAEQAPNPESRVKLGSWRDKLGMPGTVLDWRWTERDMFSLRRTLEIFDTAFRRAGLGFVQSALDSTNPPTAIFGNWHHLGTTRMHRDPASGVVDENCKVHGMANLYIAGGSVFPTGGYANPSLTIAALALRLADLLKDIGHLGTSLP